MYEKQLLPLVLFISLWSNSIKAQRQKYTFFSEVSVFRFNFEIKNSENYLLNTKQGLLVYDHPFDANKNYRNYEIHNDSLYPVVSESQGINKGTKDFRNITIGFSSPVLTKRRFILAQGLAVNYSVANSNIGILYKDNFHIKNDSAYYYDDYLRDSSFNLQFHEQTKRIGLTYDFSAGIIIAPFFRFSLGMRNTLSLNYDDKIYVQYQQLVTSGYKHRSMNCFPPLIDLGGFRLYGNDKPDNFNSQVIERKMIPQFDMLLYAKHELLLGKNKHTTFYLLCGIATKTRYGKQYKGKGYYNPIWGIGISKTI